jgi:nucleoid-associated protein YgaU
MDPRKRYGATAEFQREEGQIGGFSGLMPRRVQARAGYVEHVIVAGDRLDRLAQEYYGDPRLWWVIAQANPLSQSSSIGPGDLRYGACPQDPDDEMLKIGTRLQIPAKPEGPE